MQALSRHPLSFALLAALSSAPAFAQDAPPTEARANTLDTVIVTGTRVSDRTVAE
jgi:iron complex outermembrane receptor protein